MWQWLATEGANFREPLPNSTNYLSAWNANGQLKRLLRREENGGKPKDDAQGTPDANGDRLLPPETFTDLRPFPLNPTFQSQRVPSEELREVIWQRVMKDGKSVKDVSAELQVEMNRIGAVVRLMEIEKEWKRKGKPLARPYAKAVMEMLPRTPFNPEEERTQPHESINDLPVHSATTRQIFHPTSESRHFTRADAAKVFDDNLLPADDRVPHPELAELERDRLSGIGDEARIAKAQARTEEALKKKQAAAERRRLRDEKAVKKVYNGGRWEFRFREINVDNAGVTGRGYRGTGWRYGVPHMDRSRGEVKIPTRVE